MSALPPGRYLPAVLQGIAQGVPHVLVSDIELDSRRVTPGALFLACAGARDHGLVHVHEAMSRGAAAVAYEPHPSIDVPCLPLPTIPVDKLSRHVGVIASRFFRKPSETLQVIGITGTDGKTSTAHLVAQGFERLGTPCGYLGTLGVGRVGALAASALTTPDCISVQRTLARLLADGARACAMEVSSHALDQQRVAGTHFSGVVLTNVGRDHLDYHEDEERYAAAKRRLFFDYPARSRIFNRDDPHGRDWAAASQERVVVYGVGGDVPESGDFMLASDLQSLPQGLGFSLNTRSAQALLQAPLLGRFNAYNLLAAGAVFVEHGAALVDVAHALAASRTVPGRMEAFSGPRAAARVVVDYAHTPQALALALKALREHTHGQLWCVFGCGGDRDSGKRALMGAAAAELADQVVLTDDNPRSENPADIVAAIRQGIPPERAVEIIHDRAEAIQWAVKHAAAGDTVLIAGKGHEEVQRYGRESRAFSDRHVVAELLGTEVAS